MTKLVSTMMIVAFAIGCGGKKPAETTTTNKTDTANTDTTATGEGTPCEQEIALECPEGQIDACLKDPPASDTHTCVDQ